MQIYKIIERHGAQLAYPTSTTYLSNASLLDNLSLERQISLSSLKGGVMEKIDTQKADC